MLEETVVIRGADIIERLEEEVSHYKKVFGRNNKVFISGIIIEEFTPVIYWNRKFYRTKVSVKRPRGVEDIIPIIVSPLLLGKNSKKNLVTGKWIEVAGEINSYDTKNKNGCNHVLLFVFANVINICSDEYELKEAPYSNIVYLNGYVCKTPVFREMSSQKMQITKFIIATHGDGHIVNFIPCTTWAEDAYKAAEFKPGDDIQLYGRFQSRTYFKRYSPNSEEGEYRETYEVSVSTMK